MFAFVVTVRIFCVVLIIAFELMMWIVAAIVGALGFTAARPALQVDVRDLGVIPAILIAGVVFAVVVSAPYFIAVGTSR